GAGFIGSHVVKELLHKGHEVVVLDDLSGGFLENVPEGATMKIGSILDEQVIEELFLEHKFDFVFHLAAYAAEGLSHFIRRFNYQNNLIGSINLINASVNYNIKRFVFTSSIAVYGTNQLPLSETQIPNPEDPYGIAKYAVEMDLKNAQEMFGLEYVIFRPHNVYGIHQNIGDKYRNVVGIFMNQILKGDNLTVFGDGNQSRAFTHINDVAPYIADSVDMIKAKNKVFNIGSDVVSTVNELSVLINASMNAESPVVYLDKREEVEHAYADHSRFKEVFQPKSEILLKEGIAEMASWVKMNGARLSKQFENIEITQKLPKTWQKND
ncbi:MAG: NAD-dependent epimerase/dehydratase family protein, partial [Crocinitomicaceae bacterium]|nr:NAD-dependent epimerase/dehydratase family protein [Crocinitomicaceae bacterium]